MTFRLLLFVVVVAAAGGGCGVCAAMGSPSKTVRGKQFSGIAMNFPETLLAPPR